MSTMILDQIAYDAPRRSTVRLTRRGKMVVLALAFLALLVVGLLGANLAGAADKPLATHAVTVTTGDTLWDLASQVSHGGDVRAMEAEIEQLNHLSGGLLVVGQHIVVPD